MRILFDCSVGMIIVVNNKFEKIKCLAWIDDLKQAATKISYWVVKELCLLAETLQLITRVRDHQVALQALAVALEKKKKKEERRVKTENLQQFPCYFCIYLEIYLIFVFMFVFEKDYVIELKGLKRFRELLCVIQAIGIWIIIIVVVVFEIV